MISLRHGSGLRRASTGTMVNLCSVIAEKEMVSVADLLHRAGHHVVASRSAVVDQGSWDRRGIEAWTRR